MTSLINPVEDVARVRRPGSVTAAGVLIGVIVAAALIAVAAAWMSYVQYDGWITTAAKLSFAAADEVADERQYNLYGAIGGSVLALVVLLWFAIPLRALLRGGRVARVFALIGAFAGPGVVALLVIGSCVLGGALMAMVGAGGGFDSGSPDGLGDLDPVLTSPLQARLSAMEETEYGWSNVGAYAVLVILLAMVAVAILLVVGPSNRFFNPRRAYQPFAPGYGYAAPGYGYAYPNPQYPGQPYPSPQYPGQPYLGPQYPGHPYPPQAYADPTALPQPPQPPQAPQI
ncbi:hypothetical protein [Hamadaea tsunoensis]|uniref:hypothetical protein n=1 Tax=Hamadaea tsunoensis TaxID=53368 RepID=UPI000418BF6C|nr:hypothetical protein [Hamadaea tsunoensis]